MTISRWKVMAGVLGVSLGGLAAIAGQCPKPDAAKTRRADDAPMTAAQAATVILDGVRANEWRILVGADAELLDSLVREDPRSAYDTEFLQRIQQRGAFGGIDPNRE